MDGYKHYVRTVTGGLVIHGFSSAFEAPESMDICIGENAGRHFTLDLRNERGQFRFKYENGALVERGQTELDTEWSKRPPTPPSPDQLREQQSAQLLLAQAEANALIQQQQSQIATMLIQIAKLQKGGGA
ncbi:hypothetical protein SAMN04487970_10857 [Paenibacillus tianmuensis]|uniref:Uncharacterized protein n=1 Tax=Paenibacillus tianmuensis TaxID=624147 RepID=A0A1G4U047_9BACL|nr:hypothetical protein [Paenibacillus tianmuensis]SCW87042.1 hypothetical protein SAMN04487970_10857 [Paenibacillus tianmuensis]